MSRLFCFQEDARLILIFSNTRDQATNNVVPWLDRFGASWVRVNNDELQGKPFEVTLRHGDLEVSAGGEQFSIHDVSGIWYRKGSFWFTRPAESVPFGGDPALNRLIESTLADETRTAARYFHHLVRDLGIRALGNAIVGDPNKLVVLHEAVRAGLKIPAYEVTGVLGDHHLANPSRYITKALSDSIYLWDLDEAQRGYFSYTEDLETVLKEGSDSRAIPLSLIQEKIDKSFEIRTFYLDGKFVSTAIYSQEDDQTSVDYRKYNAITPNRNVPIVLPEDVSERLKNLFDRLEMNTGSVDLIVDQSGEFIFLEINPFGVYGGMSAICNYNIDKAIASWLCGGIENEWAEPFANVCRTA